MKRKASLILIILLLLAIGATAFAEGEIAEAEILDAKATVLEAGEIIEENDNGFKIMSQTVRVRVDSGTFKGHEVEIKNMLLDNSPANIIVNTGDKVILQIMPPYGDENFAIADYSRTSPIIYLVAIFCAVLSFIGGFKGLKALISLLITVGSIFYIFIPFTVSGYNPLLMSAAIATVGTIVTVLIISGVNKKSLSAIIGTLCGVFIAGIIPIIVSSKAHLTGLSMHESTMLMYIPQGMNFKITDILYSGIILGVLGAVMDVGMSIASSIEEIHRANPQMDKFKLFKSGLNVGRDVMGTMTNTLILAYTGSSLPLLILFYAYNTSMTKIINLDVIATEIIRSLSGSIGIVMCIPITAFIASAIMSADKFENMEK